MFDNIINAAKAYFPGRLILFAVAAIIIHALWQLVGGMAFDVLMLVKFVVEVAVAGLLASMVAGAAS